MSEVRELNFFPCAKVVRVVAIEDVTADDFRVTFSRITVQTPGGKQITCDFHPSFVPNGLCVGQSREVDIGWFGSTFSF